MAHIRSHKQLMMHPSVVRRIEASSYSMTMIVIVIVPLFSSSRKVV